MLRNKISRLNDAFRCAFLCCVLACCLPAAADSLTSVRLDKKTVINSPVLSWVVASQPSDYCASGASMGAGIKSVLVGENCITYRKSSDLCTLVTRTKTTHEDLGGLYLECLQVAQVARVSEAVAVKH